MSRPGNGPWGVTEEWARSLAMLLGGEAYQSGGNIWVVLFKRPDGRFVVIGDDGADLYHPRTITSVLRGWPPSPITSTGPTERTPP